MFRPFSNHERFTHSRHYTAESNGFFLIHISKCRCMPFQINHQMSQITGLTLIINMSYVNKFIFIDCDAICLYFSPMFFTNETVHFSSPIILCVNPA